MNSSVDDLIVNQVLSCGSGSFEMPAGTGKTHQLAACSKKVVSCGERVLVLTHTNAGVAALLSRFKQFGIKQGSFHINTICSWAEMLAEAYPETSHFDASLVRGTSDYYQMCLRCSVTLMKMEYFQTLVGRSFQCVFIDEYQDCNMIQHELVCLLKQSVKRCFVFGDRLQCIFNFSREQFPSWENDVLSAFSPLETGMLQPMRWIGRNEELGHWLLDELRPKVSNGQSAAALIKDAPAITTVEVPGNTICDELRRACFDIGGNNVTSLIIMGSVNRSQRTNLAKQLKGRFDNIEDIEGKALREAASQFDNANVRGDHAYWLACFAKECFSGLGEKSLDKTVLNAIKAGRNLERYLPTRQQFSYALSAIDQFRVSPSERSFLNACTEIECSSVSHLCLREEWQGVIDAVATAYRTGICAEKALDLTRMKAKYKRRDTANAIGSVLLVKGLEYDNVLIGAFGELKSPQEQYVALTRARDNLVVAL